MTATILDFPATEARVFAIVARVLHRHPWAPEPAVTRETEITCDIDRAGIAFGVEEEIIGRIIDEREWRAWMTAADVVASVSAHKENERA